MGDIDQSGAQDDMGMLRALCEDLDQGGCSPSKCYASTFGPGCGRLAFHFSISPIEKYQKSAVSHLGWAGISSYRWRAKPPQLESVALIEAARGYVVGLCLQAHHTQILFSCPANRFVHELPPETLASIRAIDREVVNLRTVVPRARSNDVPRHLAALASCRNQRPRSIRRIKDPYVGAVLLCIALDRGQVLQRPGRRKAGWLPLQRQRRSQPCPGTPG
jgi:hypothetical protein